MNLNYSELISKSYYILKNNRALWFFGALIALFGGAFASAGSAKDIVDIFPIKKTAVNNFDNPGFMFDFFNTNFEKIGAVFIIVILLVIVFILLVIIVNMISTIAIIRLGNDADKGQAVSIRQGFKEGFNYLLQLIALYIVLYLPFIILITIVGAIFISPGVILAMIMKGKAVGIIIAILGGLAWLLLFVVSSIFVSVVEIYAARYLILEESTVFKSIKRGYKLLMENKGPTIIVWFINLGLGFAVAIVNYIVALLIGMPAALLSKFVSVYFNVLLIFPFVSTLIIIGGFTVISYNIWTLTFSKLSSNTKNPQELSINT